MENIQDGRLVALLQNVLHEADAAGILLRITVRGTVMPLPQPLAAPLCRILDELCTNAHNYVHIHKLRWYEVTLLALPHKDGPGLAAEVANPVAKGFDIAVLQRAEKTHPPQNGLARIRQMLNREGRTLHGSFAVYTPEKLAAGSYSGTHSVLIYNLAEGPFAAVRGQQKRHGSV